MAYVEVHPKSKEIQAVLLGKKDEMFTALGKAILSTFPIPETDMILELQECRTIAFDPRAIRLESAPDVVLKLNTSDVQFQDRAATLRDRMVDAWNDVFGKDVAMELWINFFYEWGCNIDFD